MAVERYVETQVTRQNVLAVSQTRLDFRSNAAGPEPLLFALLDKDQMPVSCHASYKCDRRYRQQP